MPITVSINPALVFALWAARERERGEQFGIELCGRPVPARNTAGGIGAVSGRAVVTAKGAEAYLETKFGDRLEAARVAMKTLADACRSRDLAAEAFALYEAFRPVIPEGVKGWGARGVLNLKTIRSLAKG